MSRHAEGKSGLLLATVGRFHFLEQSRALLAAGRLVRHYCDDPRVLGLGRWAGWLPQLAIEFRWRKRFSARGAYAAAGARLARLAGSQTTIRINSGFALEALRAGHPVWVDHGSLDERWVRRILAAEAARWGVPLMSQGGNHGSDWLVDRQAEEYQRAVGIVVASQLARETLIGEGVPPGKIRVAPLGVDLRRFRPELPPREVSRPFRFLHAGPVSFNKGVHRLIRAFSTSALADRAELWVVGRFANDATETWLRRHAWGLPVRFLPPVAQAELPSLFSRCDAFVLASLADGFGLTVLQSLACGLPVVVSRWAGCAGSLRREGPVRITGIDEPELAGSMMAIREWVEASGTAQVREQSRTAVEGMEWEAHASCLVREMEGIA